MTAAWLLLLAPVPAPGSPLDSHAAVAGEYYRGDGLGLSETLVLRLDATYSYTEGGHVSEDAVSEGQFRLEGSVLTLEPRGPLSPGAALVMPQTLAIVPWGDRVYLIPEAEGANFAAHVTRREEPRTAVHGWFLLRKPDWQKPVRGSPQLPPEWQKWLLPAPVDARVTRQIARHRAQIDVGTRSSVHTGLVLTLVSKKYGWTRVTVVSAIADSSVIENDYGDPPLLVGMRVTSRP